MQLSAIDRISPPTPIDQLPVRLDLAGSRGSLAVSLLMTAGATAFLITPFALVGSFAAFQPDIFVNADLSWLSGLQLAVAFVLALVLTAFNIRRVRMAWGRSATVEIGFGVIAVVERRFGVVHRWDAPISDFLGIAHNVRSSLSGARHELVLVHPDPAKHVLLSLAPSMPQQHIDRVSILLGLLEIPARSLSGRGLARASASPVAPSEALTAVSGASAPAGVSVRPKLRLAA
jgi:hypothetical protein